MITALTPTIDKVRGTSTAPYLFRYLRNDRTRAVELRPYGLEGYELVELDLIAVPVIGKFVAVHPLGRYLNQDAADAQAIQILTGNA
jgi:hypothetical protein